MEPLKQLADALDGHVKKLAQCRRSEDLLTVAIIDMLTHLEERVLALEANRQQPPASPGTAAGAAPPTA